MSQPVDPRFAGRVDLASAQVGGRVLAANDEFFAGKENLLKHAPAVFLPDEYTDRGKWMDGWETRRRRQPGYDWAVIRLGLAGVIETAVVDTAFFRGNFPEACSLEGAAIEGPGTNEELAAAEWFELIPRSALQGDHQNVFEVTSDRRVTHVRLNIFPDGGVARLRLFGRVLPDWGSIDRSFERVNLVGLAAGGRVLGASDMFFSPPTNLMLATPPPNMGQGWETRRRRGPGHDWVALALGARGVIEEVVIDTSFFKGNAPGTVAVDVADGSSENLETLSWRPLLSETAVMPDTVHRFEVSCESPVTRARMRIAPCGGVARLELRGRSERALSDMTRLAAINSLSADDAHAGFLRCCGSQRFATLMTAARPFTHVGAMHAHADRVWAGLEARDWLEAFAAHPRIGERKADAWASKEQSGTAAAGAAVLQRLSDGNQAYFDRFGYIFIVCATGKSAEQMLELLEARLAAAPETELHTAAAEQAKITHLRLDKWIRDEH